jgi:hypothetical protein
MPKYVTLYVTSSGGVSTIHVEGEGLSPLQAPDRSEELRNFLGKDTWQDYFKKIADRAQ